MSDERPTKSQSRPEPDEPEHVVAAEHANDPESVAGEQLVHGLLGFLHHDDRVTQGRRIDRLLASMGDHDGRSGPVRKRPSLRIMTLAMAALVLLVVITLIGLPTEQSAYAMVADALEASRVAGARRYETRMLRRHQPEPVVVATIDIGAPGEMLVRARAPEGHDIVFGRNAEGYWAIRRDGGIERFAADAAWPRWLVLGESTIPIESVDSLLEQLRDRYRLTRGASEPLEGAPVLFDRVHAALDGPGGPDPERIELWIDPETRLVHRLELHWDRDRRGAAGERDRPEPGARPGGRRPPDGRRPPRDGPPPRDGGGRRDRRPPRRDGPPRWFVDGPPRFDDGHHPPPPRTVVFERVETPRFSDGWFDPATHASGQTTPDP